jgi:hypothetical protein
MALQQVAAVSLSALADLLSKAGNPKTSYLISEVLKHLASAANSKTDEEQRKTEAKMAREQLTDLMESGVIPAESLQELRSRHDNLSAELR